MFRVAVVVVNYNGGPELEKRLEAFLASVRHYGNAELVVVDNRSTDGSSEVVREFSRRTGTRAIFNERNSGYAAAANAAIAMTDAAYVAVCNMDVLVTAGWIGPLAEWLDAKPECAAVNPLLLLSGGAKINAAGQSVHVTLLGFNRYLGRPASEAPRAPEQVGGLQGAAFLVRRSALDLIGGIPEEGFLYHEDVQLSLRLRLCGFELHCVPSSRVEHDYSLSMYPEKFFLLERNRIETMLICFRRPTLMLLSAFIALTESFAWAFAMLRGPAFLSAKWRSYVSVAARLQQTRTAHERFRAVRGIGDGVALRRLTFAYEWGQFGTLARERRLRREKPALDGYCM